MAHVTLYDPSGEPFEVHPSKVSDLVLNGGWTQSKPEITEPAPEAKAEEVSWRGRRSPPPVVAPEPEEVHDDLDDADPEPSED